ncbi:MAG TPA: hypothetical protein VHE14_03005 [Solirubrobacteraceae bacterium]|nr:hypothetical protein [Solirubrobacteraceae bacterium]
MERIWPRRLRWRIRGAWLWPTFGAFLLIDAVALHELPIGGRQIDLLPGALLAGCLNLIAVVLLAPAVGMLLRRRRPALPKLVANDYAGALLIVVVAAALLAAGLLHRPSVLQEQRDRAAQFAAFRNYVLTRAPAAYRAHIALANTRLVGRRYYRTCVPGGDPKRELCMFLDAARSPPTQALDSSGQPNDSWSRINPGPP